MLVAGAFLGMFVNGMMGGYGALMAEAYPTEARATAQNVLFNLGRAVGGLDRLLSGDCFSGTHSVLQLLLGGDLCYRHGGDGLLSTRIKKAKN